MEKRKGTIVAIYMEMEQPIA